MTTQTIEQILTRQNRELREQIAERDEEIRQLKSLIGRSAPDMAWAHDVLTAQQVRMLECLYSRKSASYQFIMDWLYGSSLDAPNPDILKAFACHIRNRMRAAFPGAPQLIKTMWGHGYALTDEGRDFIDARLDAATKSVA